jgi:hypothetical protein
MNETASETAGVDRTQPRAEGRQNPSLSLLGPYTTGGLLVASAANS